MKNKLFIISTLLGIEANGQSQKPDIINSAGMTIKNPSYEVAYFLGEIAITTISNL